MTASLFFPVGFAHSSCSYGSRARWRPRRDVNVSAAERRLTGLVGMVGARGFQTYGFELRGNVPRRQIVPPGLGCRAFQQVVRQKGPAVITLPGGGGQLGLAVYVKGGSGDQAPEIR